MFDFEAPKNANFSMLPMASRYYNGMKNVLMRIYKNTLTFFSIFPIFAIGDECDVSVSYMFRHEIINTL